MSVTCDNQPFIAKAPMVLVFCADFQKWYDVFAAGGAQPRKPGVGESRRLQKPDPYCSPECSDGCLPGVWGLAPVILGMLWKTVKNTGRC